MTLDVEGQNRFVVVGCGQVGFRVASLLLALGEQVAILTHDIRPDRRAHLESAGAELTFGDGLDQNLLANLSIQDARAVLVLTSHDEVNIRVALECKRIAPEIPVIARLFDQNLAEQLEKGIGIDRALAMSILAAPSFASAAVGTDVVGEFRLAQGSYLLARTKVSEQSRLSGMTPDEIRAEHGAETVLRVDSSGRAMVEAPSDSPIMVGETVKLMGRPEDLVRVLPSVSLHAPRQAKRRSRLRDTFNTVPSTLKALLVAVLFLAAVSVLVFQTFMKLSPVDALYFVVTTLTTTGYGDITPKDASVGLKLYTCMLMGLGSAFIALLYSVITDLIVTARFRELVGAKPVPEGDHVVLVGLGDVGYRVADELAEAGMEMVIVDSHADSPYTTVMKTRHALVLGDGREPETLSKANLDKARSVVVMTGDDSVNLSVGLLAKRLAPHVRVVLRIFDPEFATAIREILKVDEALSASRLAAPEFVAAAYDQLSVAAFVFHGQLVSLSTSGEGKKLQVCGQDNVWVQTRCLTKPEVFAKA